MLCHVGYVISTIETSNCGDLVLVQSQWFKQKTSTLIISFNLTNIPQILIWNVVSVYRVVKQKLNTARYERLIQPYSAGYDQKLLQS